MRFLPRSPAKLFPGPQIRLPFDQAIDDLIADPDRSLEAQTFERGHPTIVIRDRLRIDDEISHTQFIEQLPALPIGKLLEYRPDPLVLLGGKALKNPPMIGRPCSKE